MMKRILNKKIKIFIKIKNWNKILVPLIKKTFINKKYNNQKKN